MGTRTCRPWTTGEIARFKELYPQLGAVGCAKHFPGRTVATLKQRAWLLGLHSKNGPGRPRKTEEQMG